MSPRAPPAAARAIACCLFSTVLRAQRALCSWRLRELSGRHTTRAAHASWRPPCGLKQLWDSGAGARRRRRHVGRVALFMRAGVCSQALAHTGRWCESTAGGCAQSSSAAAWRRIHCLSSPHRLRPGCVTALSPSGPRARDAAVAVAVAEGARRPWRSQPVSGGSVRRLQRRYPVPAVRCSPHCCGPVAPARCCECPVRARAWRPSSIASQRTTKDWNSRCVEPNNLKPRL